MQNWKENISKFSWEKSKWFYLLSDNEWPQKYSVAKLLTLQRWNYDKPDSISKCRDKHFANKGPSSQSYGSSSGHVWMWELDHEEGWAPNNWCFWTVVLEKTLESPLDCKEIQPVHPKGDQFWVFIGRTDAEAEVPILLPIMWASDSLEKTLMLRDIEGKRRKGWQRIRWL